MPGAPEGIGLTKKKIPALGGSSTQIVGSCFPRPAVFPVGLKLSDHRKEVESALRAWDGAGGGGWWFWAQARERTEPSGAFFRET